MDLAEYVELLRRRWLVIVATAIGGAVLMAATTIGQAPTYRADATVFFTLNNSSTVSDLAQGSTYTQGQMQSYVLLTTSPTVLNPVLASLHINSTPKSLARQLTVTSPVDTVVLTIAATSTSARQAADIANAVGAQLAVAVAALAPSGATATDRISVHTISPAVAPSTPIAPRRTLLTLGGLAGGGALAVVALVVMELLDTRVRDEGDLRDLSQAPVIGEVPTARTTESLIADAARWAGSPQGEAYRSLRANLSFMNLKRTSQAIVVSSSLPAEGKSTTAVNLAVSFVSSGARVLLVDADLRRPSVARYLGLEPGVGLATVLAGLANFDDVVQPWGPAGLDVLTSGRKPPNPLELLGSDAMVELLAAARERYDIVLVDAPPLLPVADAAVLGAVADGLIFVVNVRKVHRRDVATSLRNVQLSNARLLGMVLNRTDANHRTYYGEAPSPRRPGLLGRVPRPRAFTRTPV